MGTDAEGDALKFGRLVRQRREALGWSQEALAAAAFDNSTRKGFVSHIEKGKNPNITRQTVRSIARALKIDIEHIPPALRWPEAAEASKDADAVGEDIKRHQDDLVASLRDQAREFGIKEGMLIALARRYAEGTPGDFEAALSGLERALEVARDERDRGRLPSNMSSAVDAVVARIDALNDSGDLNGGQAALDEELAKLDEEDERRKAARARLYDKGVSQAILTRDPGNACRFLVARFDLDAPIDPDERYGAFRAVFVEWCRQGADKGRNFELEVAIALARVAVQRAGNDDQRGAMRTNLGIALRTLGARESGTARLEEAVAAFHAALEERTRGRVPIDWAMTQNSLGVALQLLGERETGTARLEEAVATYREALEERPRERVPLDWAATQNDLGTALMKLGDRESGTTRLEEAVVTYRAALEERTRERVPRDWAATQNNLGTVLMKLGDRESGTAQLEEAAAAYRAALEELTRERVPLDWAVTQNNLGTALQALGERESGTARLEEAVAAYHAALEEQTRDRVPLNWAVLQTNLGAALHALGRRESGTARLEKAIAAYRAALEEGTRERVPLGWAATQTNLGNALVTLGQRDGLMVWLEEAISAYRAALEEYKRDRVPLQWALLQNNLGNALKTLGERESGTARLEEAIMAFREALEERTRDRVPLYWAATQGNEGTALRIIAERCQDITRAELALRQIDTAREMLEAAGDAHSATYLIEQSGLAQALIEKLRNNR